MPSTTPIPVNLDYAASTPMRPEAIEAQRRYDASEIAGANPNSLHTLGRRAQAELERARRTLARTFGARVRPAEVVLTGGGTEANDLAVTGIARAVRTAHPARTRVIVSAIEHDAVLDNACRLRSEGFTVQTVRPRRDGAVAPEDLEELMGEDVALASVMLANNETGVVQPIRELAAVAHGTGALMHTDAVQGWLHIPFDVDELGVDALAVAGHKIGGPVGCGALYVRRRTPLVPIAVGGGQEVGLRPGTQDLRSHLAFAAAADAVFSALAADGPRVRALADGLYRALLRSPRIHATMGDPAAVDRLPGIVSIYVDGWSSEDLILKLDRAGFEVSAGSACSSGSLDASHVLTAMGLSRDQALGSLRISFDDRVNPADLDRFAQALLEIAG